MVKNAATTKINKINWRISRCNDVIDDDDATEASFVAFRPLRVSCIRRETLNLVETGNTNKTVLLPTWKTRPKPDPLTQSVP